MKEWTTATSAIILALRSDDMVINDSGGLKEGKGGDSAT